MSKRRILDMPPRYAGETESSWATMDTATRGANAAGDDELFEFSQSSHLSTGSEISPEHFFSKTFNDPIHGHLQMKPYLLEVIDTPQFQRLRSLKQLGSCDFVFPGATHTRFQHSIGVSHLAGELLERFKVQQPALEIEEHDVELVRMAALCHDVGHGPFSHIWDREFIPKVRPGITWTHEQMSGDILEYILDQSHSEGLDYEKGDRHTIISLIQGTPTTEQQRDRGYLWDIVNNSRNSVDVDKLDYLERDCFNIGFKSSYDASRLLKFSKVVGNEICFHRKEVFNMYEMFHTRYVLFKQVYTHRVSKAIEHMLVDAFLEADSHLGLSKSIESPASYNFTDGILDVIEWSKDKELSQARSIVERIRRRDLYSCVDEMVLSDEDTRKISGCTAEDIAGCQAEVSESSLQLRPTDLIVDEFTLNYGYKKDNPVDHVHFFSAWDSDEYFHVEKHNVSHLIPSKFYERVLRVYVKDSKKLKIAKAAFRTYRSKMCFSGCASIEADQFVDFIIIMHRHHHTTTATPIPFHPSPSKKARRKYHQTGEVTDDDY